MMRKVNEDFTYKDGQRVKGLVEGRSGKDTRVISRRKEGDKKLLGGKDDNCFCWGLLIMSVKTYVAEEKVDK